MLPYSRRCDPWGGRSPTGPGAWGRRQRPELHEPVARLLDHHRFIVERGRCLRGREQLEGRSAAALLLQTIYAPRIYFVSNGGYYTGGLGVTISPRSLQWPGPPGNQLLVFPSTNSCNTNTCPAKQTNGQRTSTVPLLSGDFVQLPLIHAGQQTLAGLHDEYDHPGHARRRLLQ